MCLVYHRLIFAVIDPTFNGPYYQCALFLLNKVTSLIQLLLNINAVYLIHNVAPRIY